MAIKYQCDICLSELEKHQLNSVQFGAMNHVCSPCMDSVNLAIELARVGPFWKQVKKLHEQVFAKRMAHLRNIDGMAERR